MLVYFITRVASSCSTTLAKPKTLYFWIFKNIKQNKKEK